MTERAWEAAHPLSSDEDPEALAVCMRALSTPGRLRVVRALHDGPVQRGELEAQLGGSPRASMEALAGAGLIERVMLPGGQRAWQLAPGALERVAQMLRT